MFSDIVAHDNLGSVQRAQKPLGLFDFPASHNSISKILTLTLSSGRLKPILRRKAKTRRRKASGCAKVEKKKSIMQAEGETHHEDAEKSEEKKSRKVKPAKFPVDAKINDYGFLHFGVRVLKALGWSKGIAVRIERNPNGSITVRKA